MTPPTAVACTIENWGVCAYDIAHTRLCAYRDERIADTRADTLVLLEHTPVYTLGRQSHANNLLITPDECARKGIAIHTVERGGDITYHGPGQLIAYPVVALPRHNRNVKAFIRMLEQTVMDVCRITHVPVRRIADMTGVWLAHTPADDGADTLPWNGEKKLASIGVAFTRWVSYHGVSFTITGDLAPFDAIHLCGLKGKKPVSLSEAAARPYSIEDITPLFTEAFTRNWHTFTHGNTCISA